jgi:hypothetical protein
MNACCLREFVDFWGRAGKAGNARHLVKVAPLIWRFMSENQLRISYFKYISRVSPDRDAPCANLAAELNCSAAKNGTLSHFRERSATHRRDADRRDAQ